MPVSGWRRRAAVCGALLLLSASVLAQPESSRVLGAWTVRCVTPGDAPRSCVMLQNLVLKTGGQPVLQFAIAQPPGEDVASVLVSLPLGISLPPGISIRIDDGAVATFPVERCEPDGCRAAMKLRPSTLAQLSAGKALTITFSDGSRKPIKVPLSLAGFADAFKALHSE